MKHLLSPSLSHYPGFPLLLLCCSLLFVHQPVDRMEGLIGPLTNAQRVWLQKQHTTRTALDEIAGRDHWSDLQKANAVFDHFTADADPILKAGEMAQEVAILKVLYPDWSLARVVFTAAWNVTKDQTHSMLDLAGLVPDWEKERIWSMGYFIGWKEIRRMRLLVLVRWFPFWAGLPREPNTLGEL